MNRGHHQNRSRDGRLLAPTVVSRRRFLQGTAVAGRAATPLPISRAVWSA
jgi:hypothetical protein